MTLLTFCKSLEELLYPKKRLKLKLLKVKKVSANKSYSQKKEISKSEKEVSKKSTRSSFHSMLTNNKLLTIAVCEKNECIKSLNQQTLRHSIQKFQRNLKSSLISREERCKERIMERKLPLLW